MVGAAEALHAAQKADQEVLQMSEAARHIRSSAVSHASVEACTRGEVAVLRAVPGDEAEERVAGRNSRLAAHKGDKLEPEAHVVRRTIAPGR